MKVHRIAKNPGKEETLDVLDELRVEEGEAGELVLVQVHHEELVCGSELGAFRRELSVKVGDVLAVFLGREEVRKDSNFLQSMVRIEWSGYQCDGQSHHFVIQLLIETLQFVPTSCSLHGESNQREIFRGCQILEI